MYRKHKTNFYLLSNEIQKNSLKKIAVNWASNAEEVTVQTLERSSYLKIIHPSEGD